MVSELEGERRWYTKTGPQILVVEAKARATIEWLLERSQPSEEIPKLRARRAEMLEEDANEIEERARQIDAVRRRKRHSEEEKEVLRDEASRLRVEAARLRTIVRQLH